MKLQYHILFIILLTEDIFCFKNDDSFKSTSHIPNLNKDIFYDTFVGNCLKNNKDDNNLPTNILQSLFCSLKKLFYKESEIEKDIKDVSDHMKEMKEDISKNSSYWSNLFKKSANEELHEIDKKSSEQLKKLKESTDNSIFSPKIFNFVSNQEVKIEERKSIDTEKNEEKKHPWFYSTDSKNIEQNKGEYSGLLKGKNSFLNIFRNDDKKENASNNTTKENESHWWFDRKNTENEQEKNDEVDKKDLSNNKERKFLFGFFSNNNENKNIEEKKEEIKNDQEKTQKQGFLFFKKDINEEKKKLDSESPTEQEYRKILPWNTTHSKEEDKKENNNEQNTYWWQRKRVSSNENIKGDETMQSNINDQDNKMEEKIEKENHSIFNFWKRENKNSNDIETKKKADTNYNGVISEETEEEKKKKEKSFFNKYEIHDDKNLKLDDSDSEYKKSDEIKTEKDDSQKTQLNSLKKYYDLNQNGNDINYLSFLNSEHEYEENVDCHPLIVFKVCLNKCYKSLSNENEEFSDKNALSVNDFKYLEKCILKCKKLSFDYVHGGCIQKNGNVLNKRQNYKDYLEEIDTYNLKLEEYPSTFSDFTFQEKYTDNKKRIKESKNIRLENKLNDTKESKNFSLLDISKEELSTHVFDKDNSEKIKNFMRNKELNTSNNITGKSFNFFKSFKNEKEDESNDEKLKDETFKEYNDNKLDLNNNDSDKNNQSNDYNYLSTSFFLILLLITFFVYLSAFTNIINQFYVSFKEKVCLFIKGHYKATFDNVYKESSESFLIKKQNNNFRNSYENLYHSFHEKPYDIA
ncbi:conserved Plasmodium protein, unknown function [Plasmodium relictum]|uniref:Uncharacterized protein n=1 Tax=Plasmodium relictum TaxID=85471 RepID=A0A1J1HF83_PLARL|nr:conserved Plasmodium protein, unknown function [Plasmodium relictum]CRH02714.1 conserved Plasmodium protein, unknown function [Plasmodium relictum]